MMLLTKDVIAARALTLLIERQGIFPLTAAGNRPFPICLIGNEAEAVRNFIVVPFFVFRHE